jgi:photosystem II stability/assembly factor-like uncharacterized protein
MDGPQAQNISAVLVDASQPSFLYAGLTNGQVFRSTTSGDTWARITTLEGQHAIYQLTQHPEQREYFYAATTGGLFVSTNKGWNWTHVRMSANSPLNGSCRVLSIDPWTPAVMYAGIQGTGIVKSTDGGLSWSESNGDLDAQKVKSCEVYDIAIDPSKPDVLYAALSGLGILKSTNAGNSWTNTTEEFTRSASAATHIAINQSSTEAVCYGTNTGNIFKSVNGGLSWSPARYGPDLDRILCLTNHPSAPGTLFAGTTVGALMSTDYGGTWQPLSPGLPHTASTVVVSGAKGDHSLYVHGQGLGLQRSTDGGLTWSHIDKNLGGASVSVVTATRAGTRIICAAGSALFRYDITRGTWRSINNGLTAGPIASVALDEDSSSIVYAGGLSGIFKTRDAGETWQRMPKSVRVLPLSFLDVHPFFKTRMFSSGEQGFFVSTDRGESWTHSQPLPERYNVRSLTFMPTNAGLVSGGTVNSGVILSSDGGFSWEPSGKGITRLDIPAVTINPEEREYFAWTADGDGFRSTNNGITWDRYSPPWKVGDTVRIAFNRYRPNEVVALVGGRTLYYSRSAGGTWVPLSSDELRAEVVSLHWNSNTSTLYAGTRDFGVYRLRIGHILDDLFDER